MGHGIGRRIHEEPSVPNVYEPSLDQPLTEGLVITIEPLVAEGGPAVRLASDGWTVRTADASQGGACRAHDRRARRPAARPDRLTFRGLSPRGRAPYLRAMHAHLAKSSLAILAVIAAIGFAAGCGSDDGGSDEPTVAEAKATLSKDCQQGKASDKPLCDCIADKLEDAGNGAKEILAFNKLVNDGKSPAAVKTAAGKCSEFAAP